MPLTEATAGSFSPEQAAALLRLLELEAGWESLRASPTWHDAAGGVEGLRTRQRAFDVYNGAAAAYRVRYGADHSAGTLGGVPVRLASWCRVVRALCDRAGAGDTPTALVEKACVAAERMGVRFGVAVERPAATGDVRAAAGVFGSLASWCDGLAEASKGRAA